MVGLILKYHHTIFQFSNPVSFSGHSQFSPAPLITTVAVFLNRAFCARHPTWDFQSNVLYNPNNSARWAWLSEFYREGAMIRRSCMDGRGPMPGISGPRTVAQAISLSKLGVFFLDTCQCKLLPLPRMRVLDSKPSPPQKALPTPPCLPPSPPFSLLCK